jgi:lysophospholipase L1-like esterase
VAVVTAFAAAGAACGSSRPNPVQPAGPEIACPAGIAADSLDGEAISVAFDVPQAVGGSQPVTVTCAPAPGSPFAVGSTTVTCAALDAVGRSASCTFVVRVIRPRLLATRFLAFGDSLTEGTISAAPTVLLVSNIDSYPFKLERLLAARYRSQIIEMFNDGVGAENAARDSFTSPGGIVRLPQSLDEHHPGVLLLMEGTNDLLGFERGAAEATAALREMVRTGKNHGTRVFLATIPPQRAGGVRRRDRVAALIPIFNESLRQIAAQEGVTLVDIYNALKDRLELIGVDDLHPTPMGYDVIAQTWFDSIKATLEERVSLAAR